MIRPVVTDTELLSVPHEVNVAFDVPIDAIPTQAATGWQLKRLGANKPISSIRTTSATELRLVYAGTAPDEVIWSGAGVEPVAVGGDAALAFDLPVPYP